MSEERITKEKILEKLAELEGKIGFYYKNLVNGETEYNADEGFRPASVVKFPMFAEICRRVHEGKVSMSDVIHVYDDEKIPGCGALRSFPGDMDVDLETLCKLMITISDNTATNLLIRHFGAAGLTAGFREMGLAISSVNRRFYDEELERQGVQNVLTPREMGLLLEEIYRDEFVDKKTSEYIKSVMLEQQIDHKIEILPTDIRVAHKTGEEDNTTNEVAIVYSNVPYIFCFFSNEADVHKCNDFIRNATFELMNGCDCDARQDA